MKLEKPLHRLNSEEKEEIIRRIRKTLEKKSEVCFTYLFGSFAKHNLVRGIDVAIWVKRGIEPLEEAIKLSEDLERETRLPVDIVVLNDAPVTLRYNVFREGKLILLRDECRNTHDQALIMAILEYADLREKYRVLSRPVKKTRLRLILGDAFGSRSRTQPSTS